MQGSHAMGTLTCKGTLDSPVRLWFDLTGASLPMQAVRNQQDPIAVPATSEFLSLSTNTQLTVQGAAAAGVASVMPPGASHNCPCRQSGGHPATWHLSCSQRGPHTHLHQTCGLWGVSCMRLQWGAHHS
jgi:hypothetical protein